jgi:phytoene dehydrogenase-like protein
MGKKTRRPGAILNFMTKGLQQWTPLQDPYDTVMFPMDQNVKPGLPNKSWYSFVSGKDKTVESIIADLDPDNQELKKRITTYLDICDEINDGFTALGLTRVMPKLLHFLVQKRVDRLFKYASMTVRDVQYSVFNLGYTADRLLTQGCAKAPIGAEPDPTLRRLKAVLTHPIGDYAVQPRDATMAAHGVTAAHYMDGACYCVGPTQNISIRESSLLREFGGEVLVDATVKEIIIERGRAVGVRVQSTTALAEAKVPADVPTTEIRAKKAVVCATSVYNLYNKLLPQDHPTVKEFQDPTKRTIQQSNGHIFLFCKIDGSAEEIPLPTHNLWYFNSYDLDEAFDSYFADPVSHRPPTVYIGFPCTKDTTWKRRYPHTSNCILISDGLWEWFERWENTHVHNRGADYEEFKAKLSKHLLDILYECVPEVKGKVSFHMLGTPLSEVTYLSSFHGGSYGTKCLPTMFDPINHKWTMTPRTPIPGLYVAGSDGYLPAVCGAMHGGLFCAAAVLGQARTLKVVLAVVHELALALQEEHPKLPYWKAYIQAWDAFLNE